MENYIYVKPALKKIPGAKEATPLRIRDPRTGTHMPAYGARVLDTTAVQRMLRKNKPNACRIQRGPDLVEITEEKFKAGKAAASEKPAPAPAPAPVDEKPAPAPSKKADKAPKADK